MINRVLVVVGSPGVGKSSVSSLLTARLGGLHVNLGILVEKEGLASGFDRKRETLVVDTERVSERVNEIFRNAEGYVVVDGHFAMDVVAPKDVSLAFVLRRNPDEIRIVLRERGFKEAKVAENVAAEILDVCLFDVVKVYTESKVCEVDVSGRNVEEIVDEMVQVVNGLRPRRIGVVDWLAKLELEGRLDEFLD